MTLSNFSQAMGLTVQNFVSAASGIAVLWRLIRGLTGIKKYGVGNFWQDLVRCTLYILLPICLVSTLGFTEANIIRVFMATLRKKLEPTPDSPQYIQTHIGVGYRMVRVE